MHRKYSYRRIPATAQFVAGSIQYWDRVTVARGRRRQRFAQESSRGTTQCRD